MGKMMKKVQGRMRIGIEMIVDLIVDLIFGY